MDGEIHFTPAGHCKTSLSWLVFPAGVDAVALINRRIFIPVFTWNYVSFPDNSVYF